MTPSSLNSLKTRFKPGRSTNVTAWQELCIGSSYLFSKGETCLFNEAPEVCELYCWFFSPSSVWLGHSVRLPDLRKTVLIARSRTKCRHRIPRSREKSGLPARSNCK